jgi:nicotinamide-nucleotide amidase
MGGVIVYSNEMKEALLDVNRTVIEDHGAVSRETAAAMSEGLEELTGSDISISVTGIAGPAGGTDEKPVGTVYIGVKTRNKEPHVEGFLLGGLDRTEFKEEVSRRVLGMVLGHLDDR